LVGVIGGLLVSRLVALANDRSVLDRQLAGLDGYITELGTEISDLVARRWEDTCTDFVAAIAETAFEERGTVTAEDLLERFGRGRTPDQRDLLPTAEDLVARIKDAFEQSQHADHLDPDQLFASGVHCPAEWADIYRAAALITTRGQYMSEAERRSVAQQLTLNRGRAVRATEPDRAKRRATEERLKTEVEELKLQRRLAAQSGSRLGNVRPMTAILVVLGIFAAVGVVQPVVLLAWRPEPMPPGLVRWLVASFTVALAALLGFLWREVTKLRPPKASASS
jgi:hypothetical protein